MGDLLVLWDVDGTLLDAGGVGNDLYGIVFSSMFGRRCEQLAPMAGRTDRAIILETLEMAGIPEPRRHVDLFIEGLREHSQLVYQAAKQRGKALPGAAEAMAAVASATVGARTIGFAVPGTALPPTAPPGARGSAADGFVGSGPEAGIPVSVIPAPARTGPVPGPGSIPVPVGGIPIGPVTVNGILMSGGPAAPAHGVPVGTMRVSPAGPVPAMALIAAGAASLVVPGTGTGTGLAVPAPTAPAPAFPAGGLGPSRGHPRPVTPHAGAPSTSPPRVTVPVSFPVGRPRPAAGRVYQSILTGNVRQLAEVKLTAVGLRFPLDLCIGAFGEDHEVRAELVHLARRRASGVYGSSSSDFSGHATIVVGDTPLDIEAALAADARAVGVATGSYSIADLREAGAHAVLDDLTSTPAVLVALLS